MSVPSLAPLVTAASGGAVATQPTGKAVWLRCVWLADTATPSDVMAFPLMSSLTVTPSVAGEVRTYAGGVQVALSRPGLSYAIKVDLPHLTRAQVTWLRNHLGRVMCVRDHQGRKHFGVYWAADFAENARNLEAATSLTIQSVTYSEAV